MIKASDLGSANACMYIADFHHKGEFGFEKSIEKRDEFRKLALEYDETTFDEYAKK